MTSERRVEANRRNAAKSTGPKSLTGLAHSSGNALKTGLYARPVLLPGEDSEAYEQLRTDIYEELSPVGRLEKTVVELIIGDIWRLERCQHIENASLEDAKKEIKSARESKFPNLMLLGPSFDKELLDWPIDWKEVLAVAHFSQELPSAIEKVSRLRQSITRELLRNILALKALQNERRTLIVEPEGQLVQPLGPRGEEPEAG